ncbi:hypothetical protein [Janibacter sp. LM]|uniref:hypothetical protein n=1 Tax=Janibacter TaxID=53457 RepID=UPI0031F6F2AC
MTDTTAAEAPLLDLVASDEAQRVCAELLDTARTSQLPLEIGTLTDEELVAYLGSEDAAGPMGVWYSSLVVEAKQLTQFATLRALTARGQFLQLVDESGQEAYRLAEPVLATLRLRDTEPRLSAQTARDDGPWWYLLRPLEGRLWLREVVTPAGMHSFHIVRVEDEEELFLTVVGVTAGAPAAAVEADLTPAQLETQTEDNSFLADCTHSTSLMAISPGQATPDVLNIHVGQDAAVFLGRRMGEHMAFRGAPGQVVVDTWRSWVAAQ